MTITTPRLELYALTPCELRLWCTDIQALEKKLSCTYKAEPMEGIFKTIVASQADIALKDNANYLWHTFWFLIRSCDRTVIGSADFRAPPDKNGKVEIGYGLGSSFTHLGYMSEAVRAMCNWALSNKGVKHITAETELNNFASQGLLKGCGFTETGRNDTIWWEL